jgi:DNA invertase Pin-like site-specific DNA recombinase
VALYCRISEDKRGRAEAVEAQERWGRAYAAEHWPGSPVVVYADNDLSAARDDVVRPAYERLRQAVRDGQVAHLCATWQSRLQRLEVGWFELASELTAAGIAELHTRHEGIVRVGDVVAGIKAVLNAYEVRQLKERLMDRLDENAVLGQPPGSKPFGYTHAEVDGVKTYAIVPDQAEAIRWAAEKILAGWSQAEITRALRERGLLGAHGGQIRPSTVRSMVTNPSVAGHRVHRGADVGKGNWEPILDEDTWQACRAKLAGPRTVNRRDGGTYPVSPSRRKPAGRKYLLTGGLAVCGLCGHALSGSVLQAAKGKPYLQCHPRNGGCGRIAIMLEATEQHVADTIFAELDKPAFLDAIAADPHVARRDEIIVALSAIDAQRTDLAGLWAAGQLAMGEWQAARDGLAEREANLQAELAAIPPSPARADIAHARAAWPQMTLDERRQFVRLFTKAVMIARAVPGRKGFDPGRVSIEWL